MPVWVSAGVFAVARDLLALFEDSSYWMTAG